MQAHVLHGATQGQHIATSGDTELPPAPSAPLLHSAKLDGPYDARGLPIMLCSVLLVAMTVVFGGALVSLSTTAPEP